MLIELTIKNFASFKEENVLSMIASKDATNEKEQVKQVGKHNILKNSIIYGANASGKSNILQAITFLKWFVINSSKDTQQGEKIKVNPFKFSTLTENEPSLLEVVFNQKGVIYRYGFEACKEKIVSEWLFARYSSRESKLFIREYQKISIFLSVCAQFNGEISNELIKWFRNVHIISSLDDKYVNTTLSILKNEGNKYEQQRQVLMDLIKGIDVGIEDIILEDENVSLEKIIDKLPMKIARKLLDELQEEVAQDNEDKRLEIIAQHVSTVHKKYDENKKIVSLETCKFNMESRGTRKIFELAGPIIDTIFSGGVLFIDEIQNSLHTKLVLGLLRFIVKNQINKDAQFIMTTHDVNILGDKSFRRDQFWFVEKNEYGESELTALIDFEEHVRKDALLDKDYLRGRYGAIPYLRL